MPPVLPDALNSSVKKKEEQTLSIQKPDRNHQLSDWRKAANFACKRGLICCTVDASERVEEETEIKGVFKPKSIKISVHFENHHRTVSVDLAIQKGDTREPKNIFPRGPLILMGEKGMSCTHADRVARGVKESGLDDFVPPFPTIPLNEILPVNPKPEPLSQIIEKAKKKFPIEAEREKKLQRAKAIKQAKKFWDLESDEKKPSYSRGFFAGMNYFMKQCGQKLRSTREFSSANRLPDKFPKSQYTAETPIPFEFLSPATKRKITLSITNPKSPKTATKRVKKKPLKKLKPATISRKDKLMFLPIIPLTLVQIPDKPNEDMEFESITDEDVCPAVKEKDCFSETEKDDSNDDYDFSAEEGNSMEDESEDEPESILYSIPPPPVSVAYSSAPSVANFVDIGCVAETEQEKEYKEIIQGLFVDEMNAVFKKVEEFIQGLPFE
jgi:hypothetical protein